MTTQREDLLAEASKIISGNRDESYGPPEDSFNAIARHWNAYLFGRTGERDSLQAGDVAAMMMLLKIARLETGGLDSKDSWLDAAGYAACGYEAVKNAKLPF